MFFRSLVWLHLLLSAKADSDYYNKTSKGEYFEGNILVTCDEVRLEYDETIYEEAKEAGTCADDLGDHRNLRRKGTDEKQEALTLTRLWDGRVNGKIKINYYFRDDSFDEDAKAIIREQADIIGKQSGVLIFVEEENQSEGYITIVKSNGCASFVGKSQFQPQRLFLGDDCLEPKDIKRLFLHSVGMWHEQSRADRDDYIQIVPNNIKPGKESNFAKRNNAKSLGNAYDYGSIMHFGSNDFSINHFPTILSKGNEIGVTEKLSTSDITQLRLMYQCVSGPREFGRFLRDICSRDCPCWDGQKGCVFDTECQGDLICQSRTCQEKPPPTSPPTQSPTKAPTKTPVKPPTPTPIQTQSRRSKKSKKGW